MGVSVKWRMCRKNIKGIVPEKSHKEGEYKGNTPLPSPIQLAQRPFTPPCAGLVEADVHLGGGHHLQRHALQLV